MNTRQPIGNLPGPISLSASFNQDRSCFAVGLDTGFCIFDTSPCEIRVSKDFNGGIGIAEMLGRANYMALVGGGKNPRFPPNRVVIWDDAKSKVAITLEFRNSVLGVRLSRSQIVVALLNAVHVYAFSSPPERLAVFETADNPLGLCALGQRYVAFPGRTAGQVQIMEIESKNISIIAAHSSPLRAIEISKDDNILATASSVGTLIRVFSTTSCARVTELRRGMDPARIFSIAISPAGDMLAVTSDKSTLHIFELPFNQQSRSTESYHENDVSAGRGWGFLGKIPLLPRAFSDIYSFTSAHFEAGDEIANASNQTGLNKVGSSTASKFGQDVPPKGIIGWLDQQNIILIGAGQDGRWEKFKLVTNDTGKRVCIREGWKRYLGSY